MFVPQAWAVVVAAYALIIFAYAFPQDFRYDARAYIIAATAAFMIKTFLFHLGLLVLLTAIIAAFIRRWRLVMAAIPFLIFTVGSAVRGYVPSAPPIVSGRSITVMSANLLHANHETAPLLSEVAVAQPDVLVLQEYAPHWHRAFQAALANDYPHAVHVKPRRFVRAGDLQQATLCGAGGC